MSNADGKVAMVQGRIVWTSGDLFKGKEQTIFGTQTPKLNQNGERSIQYGFGLAVPKAELADPTRGAIWVAMHEQAFTLYPSRQIPPSFAMKYKDGDGVDDEGKPFSMREGYQGCLVFALTTNLPIRYFRFEGGQNIQVPDGIKCGDYVNVQVMIKAHAAQGQGKAGLYLNPMAVQLVAPGKEIVNAPTGEQVFGNVAPVAPAGYVAPVAAPMPAFAFAPQGAPVMPSFASNPAAAPQPVAMPAPYPAAPAAHYGVVPQAFQPPQGGAPAPYPAAPMPGSYPPPQGQPQYATQPAGFPPLPR